MVRYLALFLLMGCDPATHLDGVTECGAQYIAPAYTLPGGPDVCWKLLPEAQRAVTVNDEGCPGAFGEVRSARGGDTVHHWAALWEHDQATYGVKQVYCSP